MDGSSRLRRLDIVLRHHGAIFGAVQPAVIVPVRSLEVACEVPIASRLGPRKIAVAILVQAIESRILGARLVGGGARWLGCALGAVLGRAYLAVFILVRGAATLRLVIRTARCQRESRADQQRSYELHRFSLVSAEIT